MRMESDEFDFLAPAYVRGFLKTYSRYLRLKSELILAEFDRRYAGEKFETAQIAALERRSKAVPRAKKLNNWTTAAVLASAVLLVLAVIGLATGPEDDDDPRRTVASAPGTPDADSSSTPTTEAAETPEPEGSIVAFSEGIDLEVIATGADSWLEVYADGDQLFYSTLAAGESETFRAEKKMYIRLGYPAGVELIVNGENLGSPGGQEPIDLIIPDDVDSLF